MTDSISARFAAMYDQALNHGSFDLTHELCLPHARFLTPFGSIDGTAAIVALIQKQRAALENLRYEIEFIFASPTGVGVISLTRGRHVQELAGVPPSGREIEARGLSIHRLVDGRSAGGWTCTPLVEALRAAHGQNP